MAHNHWAATAQAHPGGPAADSLCRQVSNATLLPHLHLLPSSLQLYRRRHYLITSAPHSIQRNLYTLHHGSFCLCVWSCSASAILQAVHTIFLQRFSALNLSLHCVFPLSCSFALAKLSPLLQSAVGLEEGDAITVHMAPAAMHLPAAAYHVSLQPMKLVVATRGLLQNIIALLKCALLRFLSLACRSILLSARLALNVF